MNLLHGSTAWVMLCALLGAACMLVWTLPVEAQLALRWRADGLAAKPWLLWTGALSHLNAAHLSVNLLALLCLCIIGVHAGAGSREALALLIAWPLTHAALLLWPPVRLYAGFSGLNHAVAGVIIARSAIEFIVNRRFQAIPFLLALMLLAKLIWEAAWSQPLRADASWGFTVVQAAHLSGFVSGALVCVLVFAVTQFKKQAAVS
ncbi:MAG: rhomboid family intramembrane serine protease [Brachymonas sp.]|nr:rhomboid family intramembrane serine protease [Brachymonas sp.]